MDKPATLDHPVLSHIQERWSPRAFSDRPVKPEVLRSLLEAARWAPSAFNDQPWCFLVATKDQSLPFSRIIEGLVPANQVWAKRAPALMVALSRTRFAMSGKPNRHAKYDLGQAVATLTVQASSMGLRLHQMGGIRREALRGAHDLPREIEPVVVIAVGYPGQPDSLPDSLARREQADRLRRPQSEFVFCGRWGELWGGGV